MVGMEIGIATMENSIGVPQKTKNRTTIWPSNPTPGHIVTPLQKKKKIKKIKPTNLNTHMHSNVHSNVIYNCQDMEAT